MVEGGQCLPQPQASPGFRTELHSKLSHSSRPQLISVCRVLLSSCPHPSSLQLVSSLENSVTLSVSQQSLLNKQGLWRAAKKGIMRSNEWRCELGWLKESTLNYQVPLTYCLLRSLLWRIHAYMKLWQSLRSVYTSLLWGQAHLQVAFLLQLLFKNVTM